jgi:hypothetical protein
MPIPNVEHVFDFGFGKAAPGMTIPAIYIAGFVSNQYGIYRSDDDARTWIKVGMWPVDSLDFISTISGDLRIYGRVYVGLGGSGFAYADTAPLEK